MPPRTRASAQAACAVLPAAQRPRSLVPYPLRVVSPFPAFPASVGLGEAHRAGLRSAPHRNAEIVVGFDRDKANRFAPNRGARKPTAMIAKPKSNPLPG